MMEHRLSELIFVLALVSLTSWTIVGVTAVIRLAVKLSYQRRARPQLRQQPEEATE